MSNMARAKETAAIIRDQLLLQEAAALAPYDPNNTNTSNRIQGNKNNRSDSSDASSDAATSSPYRSPYAPSSVCSIASTPPPSSSSLLSHLEFLPPNPALNEGRPCHVSPGVRQSVTQQRTNKQTIKHSSTSCEADRYAVIL